MVVCLAMAIRTMTVVAPFVRAAEVLCGLTHMCLVLQIFLTERHLASHAMREVVSMVTA